MARLPTPEKVREDRLRRMAQRQGLALEKSRRRDPLALDYGRYRILPGAGQVGPPGGVWAMFLTLDEVETYLTLTRYARDEIRAARTAKPDTEETPS